MGLVTRYWVLGVGYWILGTGYWGSVLGARGSVLGIRCVEGRSGNYVASSRARWRKRMYPFSIFASRVMS
jgi:hypothetical protein